MTDDMGYMRQLSAVTAQGIRVIQQKTLTYGDSWKRRLGPGAWFTMVRPWDRLENIVSGHSGDIFAAISVDPSGADGSALACVRDLRNYLTLIEAEMVSRGVVVLSTPPGTPEGGGRHVAMRSPNIAEIEILQSAAKGMGLMSDVSLSDGRSAQMNFWC